MHPHLFFLSGMTLWGACRHHSHEDLPHLDNHVYVNVDTKIWNMVSKVICSCLHYHNMIWFPSLCVTRVKSKIKALIFFSRIRRRTAHHCIKRRRRVLHRLTHRHTQNAHRNTHIHTRTRKTKDTGPPPVQSTRDTIETWPKCQWLANTHGGEQGQALGSWHAPQMGFILCHDQGCSNAGCSTIKDTIIPMPPNGPTS